MPMTATETKFHYFSRSICNHEGGCDIARPWTGKAPFIASTGVSERGATSSSIGGYSEARPETPE